MLSLCVVLPIARGFYQIRFVINTAVFVDKDL